MKREGRCKSGAAPATVTGEADANMPLARLRREGRILQRPGSQETCRSVAVICARAGCTGGRRGFSRDGRTVTKGNPHEDRRLPNRPLAAGARRGVARARAAGRRSLFDHRDRSEEHTSELQSLMRISYAVFCLKKKTEHNPKHNQK